MNIMDAFTVKARLHSHDVVRIVANDAAATTANLNTTVCRSRCCACGNSEPGRVVTVKTYLNGLGAATVIRFSKLSGE